MASPPVIKFKRERIARLLDIGTWVLYGDSVFALILAFVPISNFTAIVVSHIFLYVSFATYLVATWAAERTLSIVGIIGYLAIFGLLLLTGPIVASAIAAAQRA